MKKIIFLLIISLIFGKSQWTIILYFACDNDLSTAGYNEIAKLTGLGYNEKVKTIILLDNALFDTSPLPKIYQLLNGKVVLQRKLKEENMADINFFSDFLKFIKENYESENYFLIFYSHGNGWYQNLAKAFLYDETNQSSLSVAGGGLKEFLKKAKEILGKKIKILGFDACLMGMVEIAFEIFDYCDYLFASPSILPTSAWDYKSLIKKIEEDCDIKISELASFWAENNFNNIKTKNEEGVFVAIDLEKLRKESKRTFSLLKNTDKNLLLEKRKNLQTYPFFETVDSSAAHVDFFQLLKELAIKSEIFSSVLALKKTELYRNSCGLAIFFPDNYLTFKKYLKEYLLLTFQKEINWLEFLNDYYSADDIRPEMVKTIKIEKSKNDLFISFSQSFDLSEVTYQLFLFKSFDTSFYDPCEDFSFWENHGFSLTKQFAKKGQAFYSQEGLLLNNFLLTKEKLCLNEGGLLIFYLLYHTEESYFKKIKRDIFYVEYSFDRINFQKLDSFYGKSDYFEEIRIFLPQGNYYLRFRYQTDSSITNLGVFLDEIKIIRLKDLKTYQVFNDTNYFLYHLKKGEYYLFIIPIDQYGNKGYASDFVKIAIPSWAPIISLPNPFLKDPKILLDKEENSFFTFKIYNLKGDLIGQKMIDLNNLKRGIYFISVTNQKYRNKGKLVKL
jgi:hypothetical protein